jgi:hypothetical protein
VSQQVVDDERIGVLEAVVSVGTHADAEMDVYVGRSDHVRLNVWWADGTARVDFVHPRGGDREKSIAFLRSLSEQALRMAGAVAGLPPVGIGSAGGDAGRLPVAAGAGHGSRANPDA